MHCGTPSVAKESPTWNVGLHFGSSRTAVEWTNVFRRTDELSEEHASKGGQRTIDLVHVAIALDFRATTFLSFDQRQTRLARAAGLKVYP
jgi:predicted nucleic acid-binding protein